MSQFFQKPNLHDIRVYRVVGAKEGCFGKAGSLHVSMRDAAVPTQDDTERLHSILNCLRSLDYMIND